MVNYNGHLPALQSAFRQGKITLYLGAGVSKPNGLPSWEELVQALYFSTLKDEQVIQALQPYPNYLFALAEWVLKQKNEPLDIITRKLKQSWQNDDFITKVRETLYAGLGKSIFGNHMEGLPADIIEKNKTLAAIVDCCNRSLPGEKGIASVITYNYDNLLELGLQTVKDLHPRFQPVYKKGHRLQAGKIPIYHVHGYIPYQDEPVSYDEIIFSEEQYNNAFQDQFFWGNVVQVNQLTSNTGIMIGLSLSDRNTRRILDAIRNQPIKADNYILVKKPSFRQLNEDGPDLDEIRTLANKYLSRFPYSRLKMPDKEPGQIKNLLSKIYMYEEMEFARGFESLGLNLITFDEYEEIPAILGSMASSGG